MINSKLNKLFSSDTSLDEQIVIIENLNSYIYDGDILAEIALYILEDSESIINPFPEALDVVGTGGDGFSTLNYSTLVCLILAGMGVIIAKHGNKSVTSKCGSFDFLEKLKIAIPTNSQEALKQIESTHRVFLFAPYFHPIFKKISKAREYFAKNSEKTIFNILGPLLNPFRVKNALVGVYDERLITPMSEALVKLKIKYAIVVCGNGLDEFTITGLNKYAQIQNGNIVYKTLHPLELGFNQVSTEVIKAGDSCQNLIESRNILALELLGAKRDMLILNATMAYFLVNKFKYNLEHCLKKINKYLSKARNL